VMLKINCELGSSGAGRFYRIVIPDDDGGWWWDELEIEQAEPRVTLIQLPHLRSDLPSGAIGNFGAQGDE
jgi:hypothetical protein